MAGIRHENEIHSTGEVDEKWERQRRRDLEFTRAFLDLMEIAPHLKVLLPSLINSLTTYGGKKPNKDLPSQSPSPRTKPEGQSGL